MENLIGRKLLDINIKNIVARNRYRMEHAMKKSLNIPEVSDNSKVGFFKDEDSLHWDSMEEAIDNLLLYVAYNYVLSIGDMYLYTIEIPGDLNDSELIIEIGTDGPFLKDFATSKDFEEMTPKGEKFMYEYESLFS